MRCLWLVALTLTGTALGASGWPRSDVRPSLDLDGRWEFRLDPEDAGEREGWFGPRAEMADSILVPGCWDAQGFGAPAEKAFHNYVGRAWYRRTVEIPASWAGKRIVLSVGGVHRYADVWANGEHVRRHVGYVAPFTCDLTQIARAGEPCTLAIRVDSRQDWSIDALTGAFDIIDYMDLNWGGIHGHVSLEARDPVWVEGAFVRPRVGERRAEVEVELQASVASRRSLVVRLLDPRGKAVAEEVQALALKPGPSTRNCTLPVASPELWSPNTPRLYRVVVELRDGSRIADRWEDRFGMREIEVRGPDLYLNGTRLFLHGYGDDTIYPETIATPADPEVHRRRFRLIKEFGLNYVRHHSTVPPPDYFDAADEAGIFVQPELPIAYQPFLERGMQSPASRQLYFDTWEAMIRRLRNHPSLFGWCMGNELYGNLSLAPELYAMAKQLDGTRPAYDSDGATLAEQPRPTLDLLPVQFDVSCIPVLANTGKYDMPEPPTKPIISHEMGNFSTFPDLRDLGSYRAGIRPFWLEQTRDQLAAKGLLEEAGSWLRTSSLLQAACFKLETEACRRSPGLDGHALWLFQDYWTGTSGLVNHHFAVKGVGADYYRQFLADTVLLAELPAYCFESGDEVEVPIALSDFGERDLRGARVLWRLTDGTRAVAEGSIGPLDGAKGLTSLESLRLRMPDLAKAAKLSLRLRLDRGEPRDNSWPLWVFPRIAAPEPPEGVRVLSRLDREALDWIDAGGAAIVTRPERLLDSEPATYEPAWWKGTPGFDSHVGTVIYDTPALAGFPHEGWCDLQFLRLQHERRALLTDGLELRAGTLIRAIDCHSGNREKAFLLEARVGKGRVLLCSLDLSARSLRERPEARWLLRCLLGYVASPAFEPAGRLKLSDLRRRIAQAPDLGAVARVEGFGKLLAHEGPVTTEARYRLDSPQAWVVRGTDGTQRIEWETQPVPAGDQSVCFAFAGGLGWLSEPECEFTLTAGDLPPVRFGVAQRDSEWRSEDGRLRLLYTPDEVFGPDSLGVFRLIVPRSALTTGQPARIAVAGSASGSQRWLLLRPARAVWSEE